MSELDLGEYIDRYNPFMYKDEKSRIMHFETYKDVYLKTLQYIKEDCPKGFFDLAVFMKKHSGMDDQTALEYEHLARKNFKLFALNKLVVIDVTNWKTETMICKTILKSLHQITETEFSEEAYEWAWSEFIKSLIV